MLDFYEHQFQFLDAPMAVVYDPDSIYVKAFKLFLSEDEDSLEKLKNLNNSLLQKKLPLRDGFRFEKTETQPVIYAQ